MIDKEFFLSKLNKIEDKLLISKIIDKANKSQKIWSTTHSDFLDLYQKKIVDNVLKQSKDIEYYFHGGYDGAEREVLIFPHFLSYNDECSNIDNIFRTFRLHIKSKDSLSHRDFLGSLMGLGIKREKVGDILVKCDYCEIIVLEEIADYIFYNLRKVKNSNISIEERKISELKPVEEKIKEISSSVSSMRLDSISSLGFGFSRSKVVEYIKGLKVYVNWEIVDNCSRQIKEGDVISIRGKGRIKVDSITGVTKKGRIGVLLKKMI